MQRMGLTPRQLRTYLRGLRSTHLRRIEVDVMTLDRAHIASLTPMVLSGQVTVDVKQTPSRVASLTFVDADGLLGFNPKADPVGLHRSRLVQVRDCRWVPDLGFWVDCPVITGPVWDYKTTGGVVDITVQGMERQALGTVWSRFTAAAKTRKVRVLRELAAQYGETHLRIPDLSATLPERLSAGRGTTYWEVMDKVARSMGDRHLFYDGAGVLRLRRRPTRAAVTLGKRWQVEPVELLRAPAEYNAWDVRGAKPRGQRKQARAVAVLPDRHPDSPAFLAMNGRKHHLAEVIENSALKTDAECRKVARRHRDEAARVVTDVRASVLPIPCLDELDLVALVTDEGRKLVRVRRMSIPLTEDADPTTLGFIKRTKGGRW